jgi:rare lipoprotein A
MKLLLAIMIALLLNVPAQAKQKFTGIASFYHDKFQGRKTASGEKFDQNKLMAAHRFLKFGTKISITNTRNNKTVVVTVKDRGPFVKGRVIDLSKRAAKLIGITGLAPVVCEVI